MIPDLPVIGQHVVPFVEAVAIRGSGGIGVLIVDLFQRGGIEILTAAIAEEIGAELVPLIVDDAGAWRNAGRVDRPGWRWYPRPSGLRSSHFERPPTLTLFALRADV